MDKLIIGPMLYTVNEKYFAEGDAAFLKRSVLVTAATVGDFCLHFTSGELPQGKRQKEVVIEAMVKTIFNELEANKTEEFSLFLDPRPIPTIQRLGVTAKFNHPSDTASWVLNVTEGEFKKLQQAWRASGLPIDLFKSFCHDIVRGKIQ
jgi:hypothetical protein